jgi:hypothetical protein
VGALNFCTWLNRVLLVETYSHWDSSYKCGSPSNATREAGVAPDWMKRTERGERRARDEEKKSRAWRKKGSDSVARLLWIGPQIA